MANADNKMKTARPLYRRIWLWLLSFALLATVLALDYQRGYSLRVVHAKVVSISTSPTNPDWREIELEILSTWPAHPLVPQSLRGFFQMDPILCFLDTTGAEMMNEDIQSPCMSESSVPGQVTRPHEMEKTVFRVGLSLKPNRLNGERRFFRALQQQKGLWVRFSLGGHIFAPVAHTNPMFVSLEPYCQQHTNACAGLVGQ